MPTLLLCLLLPALATARQSQESGAEPERPSGLTLCADGAYDGYTLMSPCASRTAFLLNLKGEIVHRWEADCPTSGSMILLKNGNLLRLGPRERSPRFHGPGVGGGRLEEIDWDGNVVWRYLLPGMERWLHHDVEALPNGNLLLITWQHLEPKEALALGRDSEQVSARGFWVDSVLEIKKVLPASAEIVWQWSARDHLVQDRNPLLANFGSVPDLPGRIDINADHRDRPPLTLEEQREREKIERKMRALGYSGDEGDEGAKDDSKAEPNPDWLHTNAVAYNAEYDLIVLSTPHLNELWVIDHSTTTKEAASSSGGRWGHGGDLLWRWGNPRTYGAGQDSDQVLFYQHDPTWLVGDTPGELRLLVFNNGRGRRGDDYSSIDELILPFDPELGFLRQPGQAYGPKAPSWTYSAPDSFYSEFISGAERLPNGNTLVCSGVPGRIFEVTTEGRIVWEYWNSYRGERIGGPSQVRTAVFRANRISKDHPGLAGRKL